MISTEAMQGIRAGMSVGEAINGFVVRVFNVLEEEYRRMQRGVGPLPNLERVWAVMLGKPFYRQWAVTVATKRAVPSASAGPAQGEVDRLARRVSQLEAKRQPSDRPPPELAKKTPFIPEAKVKEWKAANVGKCWKFHLKGACPAEAGKCPLGSH